MLSLEFLVNQYRADQHPRVKTREKRAETVAQDFIQLMGEKAQ